VTSSVQPHRRVAPEFRQVISSGALRLVLLPVSAAFALATTHLLIERVGVPSFGLVSLITSLSVLLPFADLGVGAAIVNAIATSETPRDDPAIAALLLTSLRVLCGSACAIVAVGVGGALAHLWLPLLGVRGAGSGVEWAVAGAISMFGLSLPLGLGQRILLGSGRNTSTVALQSLTPPLTLILVWLLGGHHLQGGFFALCAPASALVVGVIGILLAARHTGIKLWRQGGDLLRFRSRTGSSVRRTAAPMLLITLGIPLALQTDRIILAHRSSLRALAQYAVGMQLYAPLWTVIATAGTALWPVFVRRQALGITSGVREPLRWFVLAGGCGAIVLFVGGPWAARLATGSQLDADRPLFLALGLLLLVQGAQLPVGMSLMAEPGLRFQAACVILMVPVSLVLSWLAAAPWGAKGPVFGSVVAILVCQWLPGLRRVRAMDEFAVADSRNDLVLV
jgi:O-antigen/teichoic acid export membrane protein